MDITTVCNIIVWKHGIIVPMDRNSTTFTVNNDLLLTV